MEWAQFTGVKFTDAVKAAKLSLRLREEHYPYWSIGRLGNASQVAVLAKVRGDIDEIRITGDAEERDPQDPNGEVKGGCAAIVLA